LASYSSTINSELVTLERECIALHREAAPDIKVLRDEMEVCDSILAGLQEMLLGFQADLSGLSGDIRQLQEQSRSLAIQVENRRCAEEGLRLFLERIVIPPNLAECICRGEVDELFLECVKDLEEKYAYVLVTEEDTEAGREMKQHLEKLRLRAVDRVRVYFLNVMKELRRPKTHVRMIQTHALLKYEYLVDFLLVASPTIHAEIRDVYVESMSKTMHTLFRTYHKQLLTLDLRLATRVDLICVEEAALRDAFSTKVNMRKRGDAFVLGERAKVLDGFITAEGDAVVAGTPVPPINAHVAAMNGEKYSYEMIFRSIMSHLIDASTNEYVFSRQLFKEYGQNDCFNLIFGKTLSLVLEQLETYLFNCHDAIAILLMIKLTHSYKRTVKARHIDKVLEPFLDRMTNLLWPRLKMVMDAHLRSIRGANAKKVGAGDIHPHLVSRRYAEFTCSVLLILNHMLMNDLDVMVEEMVLLLKRLADVHTSNKKRIVFMINNLDQIITIFKERRVAGKELNRFTELLVQQRELFVEEELLQTFSKMIAFVQQTECHMSGISAPRGARGVAAPADVVNPEVVESLVREFSTNWKAGIEQINRNVLSYFSNFRNGMEILKQVLTQLLLYYTRFQDVIRKVWRGKPPSFCKDLVSTSVILAEIKKHALSI
ncbi:suppressor of actin mutations protein-like protein, partial [Thalassiosira pseudonana CCMP1335]